MSPGSLGRSPCGFEVDHQLELGRLQDWEIGRLIALENRSDAAGSSLRPKRYRTGSNPVLLCPRLASAGDWLPRRKLRLKVLGSGQKFTSESLKIVCHLAIRFGAGQAKISFCPEAEICRVLHGESSLMRSSVPRANLSQLFFALTPVCAAGCSICEHRHSSIGTQYRPGWVARPTPA
jgi:hypothetical protein